MQFIQSLEPRRLFAGVTILTHGNDGSISGWVKTAASDIADRAGDDTSTYVMKVTKASSGKGLVVSSFTLDGGPGLTKSTDGEAVVRLDWTDVDDGGYSTQDVGDVVATYLQSAHGSTPALASLPLHLIGHSRGASVMSDIAQRLGEKGVWVDQVTYLDPHPVDGGIENGFVDDGDPQVRVWDNVTFADNYWRDDGLNANPDGEHITGTHELNLENQVDKSYPGFSHLAVPSYYIGTIKTDSLNGGDLPIIGSWYRNDRIRGEIGFAYSRIGGEARPTDGLRAAFGGTAERRAVTASGAQWANLDAVQVLGSGTVGIGDKIQLRDRQQDTDSSYRVDMWIDNDTNPFNGAGQKLRTLVYGKSSGTITNRINVRTDGLSAGSYYVMTRVTDSSGHARYSYSVKLNLVASSQSAPPPQTQEHKNDTTTVAASLDL